MVYSKLDDLIYFKKLSKSQIFEIKELAKIMFEIASAVQHLHSMSIVHRGNTKYFDSFFNM